MCDYFLPNSWYEPDDYSYEPECPKCDNKENTIDMAREYLSSVVEMLYSADHLDIAKLDDMIGELAHQLDCKIPAHLPRVERPSILTKWVEFNNQYLKQLA